MSVAGMLKGHDLFRSLRFDDVERVSSFSGKKSYDRGDVIFRPGVHGSHFFILVEGRVNLLIPSSDEESSLVVGRLGQGDIFGMSPLLGIDRYTTLARCKEASTVLAIEVAPFRNLLASEPVIGQNVMGVAARAYFSRYIETLRRFQHILDDLAVAP